MRIKTEITQEDFSRLLDWFSPDEDVAARKYEEIRSGLIRFFRYRGCDEGETLADETMNRVAKKLAVVEFDGNVKVSTYFYAFASRIYLENLKHERRIREKSRELAEAYERSGERESDFDPRTVCLEKCLAARPPAEREFLLSYYAGDKNALHRKQLAQKEGITIVNLHTRVSRLRGTIGKCLRKCMTTS